MPTRIRIDGQYVPFRVELDESSGQASVRFQYAMTIAIWSEAGAVHGAIEERSGSARQEKHAVGELSADAATKLVDALEANDALSRAFDHVAGTEHEERGDSCNRLLIRVGEDRAEVHYLLSTLEKAKHAAEAAIVKAVKEAAATLRAT